MMPLSVTSQMRLALAIIAVLAAVSLSAPAPLIAQPLASLPHGDRAIDTVSKLDRHDTARLLSSAEHCVGIKCRTAFTVWRATRTTFRALAHVWSAGIRDLFDRALCFHDPALPREEGGR